MFCIENHICNDVGINISGIVFDFNTCRNLELEQLAYFDT